MRDRTANQIKEGIQKEKLPKEIKLTLIRHGETKGNTEHRYLGITDEPLTGQGETETTGKKGRRVLSVCCRNGICQSHAKMS